MRAIEMSGDWSKLPLVIELVPEELPKIVTIAILNYIATVRVTNDPSASIAITDQFRRYSEKTSP
jgi:hypothetical protein